MMSNRTEISPTIEHDATRDRDDRSRSQWSVSVVVALGLLIVTQVGCSPFRGLRETIAYNDGVNDFVMGFRNSAWARQAWHEHKHEFVDQPQFVTFGQGFRDGYADVASGGSGCVPGLPPRHFWSWKYQTGEGQAKVAAWFAGYPHGARAAQEDGAGNFQQIQVSHLIEAQFSPEFRAGKCPDCKPGQVPGEYREFPPEPVPTPAPDMTSQMTPQVLPVGDWGHEPMMRIPSPGAGYYSNYEGAVVPASAQLPVR